MSPRMRNENDSATKGYFREVKVLVGHVPERGGILIIRPASRHLYFVLSTATVPCVSGSFVDSDRMLPILKGIEVGIEFPD